MKKQRRWIGTALGAAIALVLVLLLGARALPPKAVPNESRLEQTSRRPAATQTVPGIDEDLAASNPAPAQKAPEPQAEGASRAETAREDLAPLVVDQPDEEFFEDAGDEQTDDVVSDSEGDVAPFVMPEGAMYEQDVVLVRVDRSASEDLQAEALSTLQNLTGYVPSSEELELGVVSVPLPADESIEDAVTQLSESSPALLAQPNYVYDMSELLETDEDDSAGADRSTIVEQEAQEPQGTSETDPWGVDETATDDDVADETGSNEQGLPVGEDDEPDDGESGESQQQDQTQTDVENVSAPSSDSVANGQEAVATEADAKDAESLPDEASMETEAAKTSVNDPYANKQWALQSMRAYEAWSLARTNNAVTVAVLDMGFNVNHEDLKGNIVSPYDSYYKRVGASYVAPPDGTDYDHGTHVAGIIAATANNGKGVAGMSFNARIMPIKICNTAGEVRDSRGYATSESIINAFRYVMSKASQYNVRVINMSLGSSNALFKEDLEGVIEEAYNQGIVTVASAGNTTSGTAYEHYPSDLAHVVGVISLEQNGTGVRKSYTSNYNRFNYDGKDISAPGDSILSTMVDSYGYSSGSSMAAPNVSALMALMFAVKPSLSAQDAMNVLYATATDLGASGWDKTYGWGEANAYYAVLGARDGISSAQAAKVEEQRILQRDAAVRESLSYRTHVQSYGWQGWSSNGQMSGTSGESKRLEAIQIKLQGAPVGGGIEYRTHVQTYGWQGWKANGAMSGTSGESKRLEAIQIRLTGELAKLYDVWYRVHAQTFGWMGWTSNGGRAGTASMSKRLEAIEIRIQPKGTAAPGSTSGAYRTHQVSYHTHVQTYGWQGWVYDGETSGTSGQSKRLEGIEIALTDQPVSGGIEYRTHVQTYGWQGWRANGAMSGTSGQSKRLEAIQIRLTGQMAGRYDVWYRVHAQTFGWMGWAANGASAGTAGYAKRLEAIQVVLRAKGSGAPGSTANAFRQQ